MSSVNPTSATAIAPPTLSRRRWGIIFILLLAAVMGFATAAVSFILLVRFYQNFSIPESDVRLGESMLIKKVEAAA